MLITGEVNMKAPSLILGCPKTPHQQVTWAQLAEVTRIWIRYDCPVIDLDSRFWHAHTLSP